MKEGNKILIAPLDWGLGHAARCVPIINHLINKKLEIIIAGSHSTNYYLEKHFPDLEYVLLPTAKISYSKSGMLSPKFLLSILRFAIKIQKEHKAIEQIIEEKGIKYLISDNRLGLYTKKAKTFYLTHQLTFDNGYLCKIAAFVMKKVHTHYIKKYDYCCVPDVNSELALAGKLTKSSLKTHYIGPQSRFSGQKFKTINSDFDLLILSGVEPQRTIFENIVVEKYKSSAERKLVIIRGLLDPNAELHFASNISYFNNPSDSQFAELVLSAERIFCRSGYSTLCDLAALKRRAILIPTPRQPEQQYLAKYFHEKYEFPTYSQKKLQHIDFDDLDYRQNWNYTMQAELELISNCE